MSSLYPEHYILCEGFHDRAFWYGWLLENGWKGDRKRTDERSVKFEHDGGYPCLSPENHLITYILPCKGWNNILRSFGIRYKAIQGEMNAAQEKREPLGRYKFILNVDDDTPIKPVDEDAEETTPVETFSYTLHIDLVRSKMKSLDPNTIEDDDCFYLADRHCEVRIVRWQVDTPDNSGLPAKQTLERMDCAAIRTAYPQRTETVNRWLSSRSEEDRPKETPKEHAWSYMAGGDPEHGCDDFYRRVWSDEKIRKELEDILRDNGSWGIFEEFAQQ